MITSLQTCTSFQISYLFQLHAEPRTRSWTAATPARQRQFHFFSILTGLPLVNYLRSVFITCMRSCIAQRNALQEEFQLSIHDTLWFRASRVASDWPHAACIASRAKCAAHHKSLHWHKECALPATQHRQTTAWGNFSYVVHSAARKLSMLCRSLSPRHAALSRHISSASASSIWAGGFSLTGLQNKAGLWMADLTAAKKQAGRRTTLRRAAHVAQRAMQSFLKEGSNQQACLIVGVEWPQVE